MTEVYPPQSVAYLMQRVQRRLAQMTGPGIHLTTEDSLIEHIISSFYAVFNEYWWPQYTTWFKTSLDQETGAPVHDLSQLEMPLREFYDIQDVIEDGSEMPLRVLPAGFIPTKVTGNRSMYIMPYPERPDKVFRVVPFTSQGDLHIHYRSRPININLDTVLRVDEEYLVAAAAYVYLTDDGTNPGATALARERLDATQRTVRDMLSQIIPVGGVTPGPVDYWWASS
jgi:hypothetical protein